MAGRLQNEDHKTEAELVAAGGAKSQLLNDTKVYVTANSINKTLDDAIIDGDIGGGGGNLSVASKTANYTLTTGDDVILANSSGGAFTLTLPTAVGNSGKVFYLKKTDSSFNAVTIDGNGTETIDGSTTKTIATQHEQWTIVSDGSNWQAISHKSTTPMASYTPTGTWVANATYTGRWRRDGDLLVGHARVECSGGQDAGNLVFSIPSGLTIDTNKLPLASNLTRIGDCYIEDASSNSFAAGACYYHSTTQVSARHLRLAGIYDYPNVDNTSPVTFTTNDGVGVSFVVPIVGWEA